jgi:hypothetical protein
MQMNLKLALSALMVVACGKVQLAPDASIDSSLPDALSCPAAQLACGSTCVDPMKSSDHCGACDIACDPMHATCMAGHCVDYFTSCAAIKAAAPTSTTGSYTLIDNSLVYCDMEHSMQYTGIGMGQYNVAHAGFDMISATDLNDPAFQKIFVLFFNHLNGALPTIAPWVGSNCCFKSSATAGMVLELSASVLFVTTPNTTTLQCNLPSPGYTASYGFEITGTSTAAIAPMADNFFVAHPATEVSGCSDANNPAFFWQRAAF